MKRHYQHVVLEVASLHYYYNIDTYQATTKLKDAVYNAHHKIIPSLIISQHMPLTGMHPYKIFDKTKLI
jgi:hypothetical protein